MADPMDGTAAGLMAFLDYTAEKGLLNKGTANAIKVTCREVLLHAEGEGWESKEVRNLDVEDVLRRFETKRATKYTPASLRTYKTRFRNAITMYRGFLQDPGGWRPSKQPRPPRPKVMTIATPRRHNNSPQEEEASKPPSTEDVAERPDMMTYPFPIRRDGNVVFARLILPNDLTPKEAERIAAHIRTLAVEPPASSPPDPDDEPPH
jgi:hypothetical protein